MIVLTESWMSLLCAEHSGFAFGNSGFVYRSGTLLFSLRFSWLSSVSSGTREVVPWIFLRPLSFTQCTQDILNICTQLFNFNFNYQHTTQCLDCGEYIYKQLHLGRMHTSLYYLLCNSAPWWCSSTTETCRCYKLRKYIHNLCILLVFISNYITMHGVEHIKRVIQFKLTFTKIPIFRYFAWLILHTHIIRIAPLSKTNSTKRTKWPTLIIYIIPEQPRLKWGTS